MKTPKTIRILKVIGEACKKSRIGHNKKIMDIASDFGCTYENVHLFEKGQVNNLALFKIYCEMDSSLANLLVEEI